MSIAGYNIDSPQLRRWGVVVAYLSTLSKAAFSSGYQDEIPETF